MPTYVSICGFEIGDVVSEPGGSAGTATIQSTVKRSGQYALRCNPVTTASSRCGPVVYQNADEAASVWSATQAPTSPLTTVYDRVFLRIDALPSAEEQILVQVMTSGSTVFSLGITSTGTVNARNFSGVLLASGTIPLVADASTWNCIQFKSGVVSGDYELRVNGVVDFTGTAATTAAAHGGVYIGKASNTNGSGYDIYFDDYARCSDDFPPLHAKIVRLDPDGNSATDVGWAASAGAKNACVDDFVGAADHNSDTDYINSSTNAARYSATLESAAAKGITGTVQCVKPMLVPRDISNTTNIKYGYRTPAGAHTSTNTEDLAGAYVWRQRVFSNDNGAAWTLAKVDALEVSVIHNQAQARELRCTAMCAMVEFVPDPVGRLKQVLAAVPTGAL